MNVFSSMRPSFSAQVASAHRGCGSCRSRGRVRRERAGAEIGGRLVGKFTEHVKLQLAGVHGSSCAVPCSRTMKFTLKVSRSATICRSSATVRPSISIVALFAGRFTGSRTARGRLLQAPRAALRSLSLGSDRGGGCLDPLQRSGSAVLQLLRRSPSKTSRFRMPPISVFPSS